MRNYRRLATAGVPCPEALLLKEHVMPLRLQPTPCSPLPGSPSASNPPLAAPCLAGCFQPLTHRRRAAPYSRLNVPAATAPVILT